jgi:hypothetical protein
MAMPLRPASIDLSPEPNPKTRTRVQRTERVRRVARGTAEDAGLAICEVASESKPDKWYTVYEQQDGTLFCGCPDYIYRRRARGEECKHLRELRLQGLLQVVEPARQRVTSDLSLPRFLILDIPEVSDATRSDQSHHYTGRPRNRRRRRRKRPVV